MFVFQNLRFRLHFECTNIGSVGCSVCCCCCSFVGCYRVFTNKLDIDWLSDWWTTSLTELTLDFSGFVFIVNCFSECGIRTKLWWWWLCVLCVVFVVIMAVCMCLLTVAFLLSLEASVIKYVSLVLIHNTEWKFAKLCWHLLRNCFKIACKLSISLKNHPSCHQTHPEQISMELLMCAPGRRGQRCCIVYKKTWIFNKTRTMYKNNSNSGDDSSDNYNHNIGTVSFGWLLLAHDKAKFKYLLDAVMNIDIFIQSVKVYKTWWWSMRHFIYLIAALA